MTLGELEKVGFVSSRSCSICNVSIGYSIHPEYAAAVFNSGCGCSGGGNYRPITRSELKELKLPEATNADR